MAEMGKCSKCGTQLMIGVRVSDRTANGIDWYEMQVTVDRNPAGLFKQRLGLKVNAHACGSCGFLEFYVEEPDALREAHEDAERRLAEG